MKDATQTKYDLGKHPKSLANLRPNTKGRPKTYGEDKKQRYLSVTETGWDGAQELAEILKCNGISDLIEKLGRGELKVSEIEA